MRKYCYILMCAPSVALAETCPAGMVAYEYVSFVSAVSGECPSGYIAHDVVDVCASGMSAACWIVAQERALCRAGVGNIKTSTGISVRLYADKSTQPSLCVQYNDTVCYADLEQGRQSDTINVKYNGDIYHAVK